MYKNYTHFTLIDNGCYALSGSYNDLFNVLEDDEVENEVNRLSINYE